MVKHRGARSRIKREYKECTDGDKPYALRREKQIARAAKPAPHSGNGNHARGFYARSSYL